jgi:hypothetical protein
MPLSLRPVEPGRGAHWIADAFRLYVRRPFAFTAMFAAFLVAALVASLVPVVGALLQMMLLPMLSLGFMVASQSALLEGPVHPGQFVEPLRGDPVRRRSLLVLCAVYGFAAFAILWLADAVSDHAMARLQALVAREGSEEEIDALLAEPGLAAAALLMFGLGSLLSVPFWHAPALVHWGGQGPWQALFSSTLAVWRCKGAFLVYALAWGAVVLAFGVASALVFGLLGASSLSPYAATPAALVLSTVFYVSLLFTFNDSFGGSRTPAPPSSTLGHDSAL